jgi:hypothetical protein
MNIDRLLRDFEGRLAGRDETLRRELVDGLREAIARERRWLDPSLTVEAERERRVMAEEMRDVVEAVGRPARLDEALEEALRQLMRIVEVDAGLVAAFEPGTGFRVAALLGHDSDSLLGQLLDDPRLEALRETRQPIVVADAETEAAPAPFGGVPPLRSWAALPLLHEGELVGLLVTGRRSLSGFTEAELHRTKQIAFAAGAALARGQQIAQLRRYIVMLEQVIEIDQRVFRGEGGERLGQAILDGACRVGGYRGGMLVLQSPRGPTVVAAAGEAFAPVVGRAAPADLASTAARRLSADRMLNVAESLGVSLPAVQTFLVPLAGPDAYVGCLVLLDPNGETPDDRLIEAFASRAAAAWRHAALAQPRA